MSTNSKQINGWHGTLSDANRRKIVTVASQNGDVFTRKEEGFVEGGTMVVVPEDEGHLQQCVDPNSRMLQIAVDILNACARKIHEQMGIQPPNSSPLQPA